MNIKEIELDAVKPAKRYAVALYEAAEGLDLDNIFNQVNFAANTVCSNEDFKNFANMLTERSQYNFNTTVNENDHILTLSTCYNSSEKMVIHAKLIKKETR